MSELHCSHFIFNLLCIVALYKQWGEKQPLERYKAWYNMRTSCLSDGSNCFSRSKLHFDIIVGGRDLLKLIYAWNNIIALLTSGKSNIAPNSN